MGEISKMLVLGKKLAQVFNASEQWNKPRNRQEIAKLVLGFAKQALSYSEKINEWDMFGQHLECDEENLPICKTCGIKCGNETDLYCGALYLAAWHNLNQVSGPYCSTSCLLIDLIKHSNFEELNHLENPEIED